MRNKPLVSIIMNCYNGEKYLKNSVRSVLRQTYRNWELIFWDNCSTDNSSKIIKKFKDKRIKYFRGNKLVNLYSARNLAVKKAKGIFVSFLDTDDWLIPSKLKKQIKLYNNNKSIKFIYSNCFLYYQKNKKKELFEKKKLPEGKVTQSLLNNYRVGFLTIMIKRNIFKNNLFNNKYNIIGDFDFIVRVSRKINFSCIQQPLTYYRHHEENLTKQNIDTYLNEIKDWLKKNKKNFERSGFSLVGIKILFRKLQFKYIIKKVF